jgi:hypothetical protein
MDTLLRSPPDTPLRRKPPACSVRCQGVSGAVRGSRSHIGRALYMKAVIRSGSQVEGLCGRDGCMQTALVVAKESTYATLSSTAHGGFRPGAYVTKSGLIKGDLELPGCRRAALVPTRAPVPNRVPTPDAAVPPTCAIVARGWCAALVGGANAWLLGPCHGTLLTTGAKLGGRAMLPAHCCSPKMRLPRREWEVLPVDALLQLTT